MERMSIQTNLEVLSSSDHLMHGDNEIMRVSVNRNGHRGQREQIDF